MYYVFRKSVNSDEIKNCEKYTDLQEAKYAAQDEEYYRSHSNVQAERDGFRVVLASTDEVWSDLTKDQYKYEELDYNN
ncbi:MAG: hypothetical protein E7A81_03610 [Clostridiales bacterium]|nr:hypothetical protein [Clostridiales bacterium]MDU1042335.1 hypothetical protein [Clostridiales bacterium]MDU3490079.1 hypothetical protein [Clostridiales bacterium]